MAYRRTMRKRTRRHRQRQLRRSMRGGQAEGNVWPMPAFRGGSKKTRRVKKTKRLGRSGKIGGFTYHFGRQPHPF